MADTHPHALHHDEVLEGVMSQLGEFGKYQMRQHVLHLLGAYLAGVHMLSLVWTAPTPDYRCQIHDIDVAHITTNVSLYIPFNSKTNALDQCMVYKQPGDPAFGTRPCGGPYVYNSEYYASSRVIDLGLICDKRWMRALLQSIYMLGVLCGAVTLGSLADSFGRKPIFYISALLQLLFAVICAFIPTYYWLAVFLFFYGAFGSGGAYVTGFVLSMELIGRTKRTVCGTMFSFMFAVGIMSDSFWGWLIPGNYQHLQLAYACHSVLLLGHWWLIDESIRWLWGKGRTDEALRIARAALAVNGKTLILAVAPTAETKSQQAPSESQMTEYTFITVSTGHTMSTYTNGKSTIGAISLKGDNGEGEEIKVVNPNPHPPHAGVVDLFRQPNLRVRTLIMGYSWFANSLVYYGLNFNAGNLPGNPFLMSFLSGISEVPGYIIVILLLDRLGRRFVETAMVFVGGLACIIIAFFEQGSAVITIAMLAKVAAAGSFGICYNYTAELFPTVIRNSVVGITTMAARGAGMLAPSIILLDEYGHAIPTLVFGAVAILAAFLTLFLPETLNKEMPQTIDEGNDFGKGDTAFHTIFNICKRNKKDKSDDDDNDDLDVDKKDQNK